MFDLWMELKISHCHAVLWIEGGVFFKESWMEGGRGSGGPASHTHTFPDLVPPQGKISPKSNIIQKTFIWSWWQQEIMAKWSNLTLMSASVPVSYWYIYVLRALAGICLPIIHVTVHFIWWPQVKQITLLFWSSDYRQTESDAYDPTVHWHRCAQKLPLFGSIYFERHLSHRVGIKYCLSLRPAYLVKAFMTKCSKLEKHFNVSLCELYQIMTNPIFSRNNSTVKVTICQLVSICWILDNIIMAKSIDQFSSQWLMNWKNS